MDVPWHSTASKRIRTFRLLITLGSLILLYLETVPAFNEYGPSTRMCRQIISFHCSKVEDTEWNRLYNPVCFENKKTGYPGCRNIQTPSNFEECGFPNYELGLSCENQNHSDATNIKYIVERFWVAEDLPEPAFPGQSRRSNNHTVRTCERVQCISNDMPDYSTVFQIAEMFFVSMFVIELCTRIAASTRPAPLETQGEQRKRKSMHWTWSRLCNPICGSICSFFEGCSCCQVLCCSNSNGSWSVSSFFSVRHDHAAVHKKDPGLEELVQEKHKEEPVIYGLWEWVCQISNQLDTFAIVTAAVEVIYVPITFSSGYRYEVWGVGLALFDPAVFRVTRVLVSARFISMERFFDDTTAIRKTVSAVSVKLLAPVFFLFVFVLIMASLFLWLEVTISADLFQCSDWPFILNSEHLTQAEFDAHCTKCPSMAVIDYSDSYLGLAERYNGTCRRLIIPTDSSTPQKRVEPPVQTFSEAIWFMFVTVTTTGYGRDGIAVTYLGRIVMCFTAIMGTLYVAMPLSVVSAKFFEIFTKMNEAAKHKILKKSQEKNVQMLKEQASKKELVKHTSVAWQKKASKLTFKMIVTLKMMAHRVRRRSMLRAPLTITQQHLILDYEDQVFVLHEQLWTSEYINTNTENESNQSGGSNGSGQENENVIENRTGRIVQLEAMQSLRDLHMRMMYSILRQLGRGDYLHETMRVTHANDDLPR